MLDALGNLGDFVGGIAVVVTLAYLAVQVRQNTAALRATSRQQVVSGMRDHLRMRTDRESARIWRTGLRSFPDLPIDERDLFGALFGDLALFMQGAFALRDSGTLDDETWQAYLDFFAAIASTPGGSVWWEHYGRPIYAKGMVSVVDARLAQGGILDLLAMEPPATASSRD